MADEDNWEAMLAEFHETSDSESPASVTRVSARARDWNEAIRIISWSCLTIEIILIQPTGQF